MCCEGWKPVTRQAAQACLGPHPDLPQLSRAPSPGRLCSVCGEPQSEVRKHMGPILP